MSWTPENSAIRMTPTLEKEISKASAEEIKAILARASVEQGLVTRDIFDPQVLLPTDLAGAAPRAFAKTVTINGKKFVLEGKTELELASAETALFRQVFESGNQTQQTEQARDPVTGKFVAESTAEEREAEALEIGRQTDLELRWKRGEISSDVYLAESGALDRALQARGINPDLLAEASAVRQEENYEDAWATATQEFLNSPAGQNWPGGNENMLVLGHILEANPDLMHKPSAESLAAAYEYARENNLLVPNPESEIANAQSPSELRNLLQPPARRTAVENGMSTGLFGR